MIKCVYSVEIDKMFLKLCVQHSMLFAKNVVLSSFVNCVICNVLYPSHAIREVWFILVFLPSFTNKIQKKNVGMYSER